MENYAAVLHGAKDLRLTKRTIALPAAGEAQIAIKATGLCGSDRESSRQELPHERGEWGHREGAGADAQYLNTVHYYIHGRNGEYVLRDPMALGHESAGIVTAIGSGVSELKVGDRVAVEAGIYCRECRLCKLGRYNLCTKMRFASSAKVYPHQDGTLQSLINHPVPFLHKIPDSCTYEQASLVEPLSVVMNASRRAGIRAGHRVLVLGAGAVGLLACSVASAHGATNVVIVDIVEDRVNFATREGFAHAGHILARSPRPETPAAGLEAAKATADLILAKYGQDDGFDIVLECTGVESCMQAAIHTARPGGKVVYIGMGTPNATLPISAAAFREVDVMGVFRYANTYPDALALFGAGKLPNAEKLVTHHFTLANVNEAFDTLLAGKDPQGNMVMKLMVTDF
ncbi:L-iditol 2-dehydrogenase, partial [Phenoliferia sp. Uapishka_3]